MQVLLNNPLMGIQRQDHHLGIGDGFQGFDNREFLYRFTHIFALSNASSVDQRIAPTAALVIDINAITSRARLIKDHHTLFT